MSVLETALIYGGIPLAVVLLVVIWVYGRSLAHQPNRYRPGRPWTYPPVWYLPHAGTLDSGEFDRRALEGETRRTTAVGGASGEW